MTHPQSLLFVQAMYSHFLYQSDVGFIGYFGVNFLFAKLLISLGVKKKPRRQLDAAGCLAPGLLSVGSLNETNKTIRIR